MIFEIIKSTREVADVYRRTAMMLSEPWFYEACETMKDYALFLEECVKDGVFATLTDEDAAMWVMRDLMQKIRACRVFADEESTKNHYETAVNLGISANTYTYFGQGLLDRIEKM